MNFGTCALCNTCTLQHMHFATLTLCNTFTLQHVHLATCFLNGCLKLFLICGWKIPLIKFSKISIIKVWEIYAVRKMQYMICNVYNGLESVRYNVDCLWPYFLHFATCALFMLLCAQGNMHRASKKNQLHGSAKRVY